MQWFSFDPRVVLVLVGLALIAGVPDPLPGFEVKTIPASPELEGTPVTLQLKEIAMGVGASAETPFGSVEGRVGETIPLGQYDTVPQRPVELRVTLPEGSYYRSVSREELRAGQKQLTIYPSGDEGSVSIEQHRVEVQPIRNRLMAREVVVVRNPTDHRLGGPSRPLRVPLPPGAERLDFKVGAGHPDDVRSDTGGYAYRLSFAPGRTLLAYYYMVTTRGDTYTMTRPITVPTDRYILSVPEMEGMRVESDHLRKHTASQGEQTPSRLRFVGTGLRPGDQATVRFGGIANLQGFGGMGPGGEGSSPSSEPDGPRPNSLSSVSWPLVLGIVFSIVVFVGSYAYVRYALANDPPGRGAPDFLAEEIARLDQEHKDGAIPDPYYKRTRRRWKNELQEQQSRESTDV